MFSELPTCRDHGEAGILLDFLAIILLWKTLVPGPNQQNHRNAKKACVEFCHYQPQCPPYTVPPVTYLLRAPASSPVRMRLACNLLFLCKSAQEKVFLDEVVLLNI